MNSEINKEIKKADIQNIALDGLDFISGTCGDSTISNT